MKLFDLLKSLNNDVATNPDARRNMPDSNQHLLQELHHLLALLDAQTPTLPVPIRTQDDPPALALNLASIFDDGAEPEPSTPDSATATVTQTYRPVVRELLDEFLPMLTQTLGDRLDQLDDITLQQWRQAIAQHVGESEPAAK